MEDQVAQPTEQVTAPEQPQPQPQVQDIPVGTDVLQEVTKTPEQSFYERYLALCTETGYELKYEAKPVLTGNIFDFSKVTVQLTVGKKA